MSSIEPKQIRNLQGQLILVLENVNGDYWLVCRISTRDIPICSEEYQLPFPRLQAQFTFTAELSERWLRFYSKWIGSITDAELTAVKSLRFCKDRQKPIPKNLEAKIGPEWSLDWELQDLEMFDHVVRYEQQEFEKVLEPKEA